MVVTPCPWALEQIAMTWCDKAGTGRQQDRVLLGGTHHRKLPMLSLCPAVLIHAPLKAHDGQNMGIFQIKA